MQVLELDKAGHILHRFGSDRGSKTTDQLNWPWYILVVEKTNDECQYLIADRNNYRVLALSSELESTGVVIDSPQGPSRMCLTATAGDRILIAELHSVHVFTLR